MYPKLKYPCTNESIEAVVAGLDLKKTDVVVSIGGSGDIPFAIAPHVGQVYAVDSSEVQTSFMAEQAGCMRANDFVEFCGMWRVSEDALREGALNYSPDEMGDVSVGNFVARERYFSGDRFLSCRAAIDRVRVVNTDIIEFLKGRKRVNKLYLSNSLGWSREPVSREDMGVIVSSIVLGGLAYETTYSGANSHLGGSLRLISHMRLTSKAEKIQLSENYGGHIWTPRVYRKVL
ncbi:MAG: hypothetical protein QF381_02930 [Nitrososphaerales archaeon]|jgi:hypothetical protein|nr:hypothetical protein [Nitrososphaerales archaeon]